MILYVSSTKFETSQVNVFYSKQEFDFILIIITLLLDSLYAHNTFAIARKVKNKMTIEQNKQTVHARIQNIFRGGGQLFELATRVWGIILVILWYDL